MSGEHGRDNRLDLEKLEIARRLGDLEKTVGKAFSKLYGDPDANPPVLSLEARIRELEETEKEREKSRQNLIQTALGAVAIAIGAIVLWVFTVIRDAFIHPK